MRALAALGHLLFRTRNVVFPILLLVVAGFCLPRPLGQGIDAYLIAGGFVVLAIGQGLRVITIGLDYIQRGGKNGRIHADRLVTGGLFGCCRNPMYTGNVLMIGGFFLLSSNLAGIVIGPLIGWFVYRAIIAGEEQFLAAEFGSDYRAYRQRVPRWLPSPRATMDILRSHRFDWPSVVIREYGTLFTTTLIVLALIAWKAYRAGSLDSWSPLLAAVAVAAILAYATARFLKKSRRLRPLERS